MSLDSLHNLDYQKRFIRDAAQWLRANTPGHASLVSNNQYLAYFSSRRFDWETATANEFQLWNILADAERWRTHDFMAMRVRRGDTAAWQDFLQAHSLRETLFFEGGRHGRISIVQLHPAGKSGPDEHQR